MLLRVSEIYWEMLKDFYNLIRYTFKYKFVNIILRTRKIIIIGKISIYIMN